MKNLRILIKLSSILFLLTLFSCENKAEINENDLVDLLSKGLVDKITVVDKEFAEIKLNNSKLKLSTLKTKYEHDVIHIIYIDSFEKFITLIEESQKELSLDEQIGYGINTQQSFGNWLISWGIFLFLGGLIIIFPLILILIMTSKMKRLEKRIRVLEELKDK